MKRPPLLIVITFIESFATISLERGVYFYTQNRLNFSDSENLSLALVFGLFYIAGALVSHPVSRRTGEKRLLLALIIAQGIAHLALAAHPTTLTVFLGFSLIGSFNGMKWPVIESFVSAGKDPKQAAHIVGAFNLSWAAAIPVTMIFVGPLIKLSPMALFILPAGLNLISFILCRPLPPHPPHIPHDHPSRPDPQALRRWGNLLSASRLLMLSSYCSMWILVALMPTIFRNLGYVVLGPMLSGVMDITRIFTFILLWRWHGWHGRFSPLMICMVVLPAGFFMVLLSDQLPVVLLGEAFFGISAGVLYYSSLYCAMVVKNASVDAGGSHEGLIGTGFALGPAAGLLGLGLTNVLGGPLYGNLLGVGPIFLLCAIGAVRFTLKAGKRSEKTTSLDLP